MNTKTYEKNDMNYGVFYPEKHENMPLVVYLHGAGERGKNYEHIYRHGLAKAVAAGKEYNAVILCPQCPENYVWDGMVKELYDIINTVACEYKLDKTRIYITGSSMGGFGTYAMTQTYPDLFAAAAPVSAGGMSWRCPNLRTTPIKAYHGAKDFDVPVEYAKLMIAAVKKSGDGELVVFDELGHNDCIDYTYFHTDIIDWLLTHRKNTDEHIEEIMKEFF